MMRSLMQSRFEKRSSEAAARVAVGYALLATLSMALSVAIRDGLPWTHPEPWLALSPATSHAASAALGLGTATTLVFVTRLLVWRYRWAQRLHVDLRPVARDLSPPQILLVAGLSSLGEELFFRGVLVPLVGVVVSSIAFGALHQVRGPSRWVWAAWASIVGVALAAIFAATGSLLGPILAHALVNAANLSFLRDHDPTEPAQAV